MLAFQRTSSRRIGATLCLGFIYVRSSPNTVALWRYLADFMSKSNHPDDQRIINQILMESWIKYTKRPRYIGHDETDVLQLRMKYGEGFLNMPETLGKIDRKFVRIALLGHESFRRVCEGQKILSVKLSTIMHCSSEKAGIAKQDLLVKLGSWLLKDDWFNITSGIGSSSHNFNAYLLDALDRRKLERSCHFNGPFALRK